MALGIEVGGEDTGAGAAGEHGMHEADGALADHKHRVVGAEVEHLDALEHGVDGFEEGGLLKWNAIGNGNDSTT